MTSASPTLRLQLADTPPSEESELPRDYLNEVFEYRAGLRSRFFLVQSQHVDAACDHYESEIAALKQSIAMLQTAARSEREG